MFALLLCALGRHTPYRQPIDGYRICTRCYGRIRGPVGQPTSALKE